MNELKWIDLFQFLNERANDFKNIGKFDWQGDVKIYDNAYGGLFSADLIEFNEDGKKIICLKIDSGDN